MHPDIPEEQAYFDRALELRDRLEANRASAAGRGSDAADPRTATELRRRAGALGVVDPGAAVAFGRIEFDGNRLYLGKQAIWDENNELVVVNWQAPIVAPFYTANMEDPEGLDARRIYHCRDNRILDIEETVFSNLEAAVTNRRPPAGPASPPLDDPLLESLRRTRTGELGDIVASIQAEQYGVITRDTEQLLVVQGGPGTGKTVVGLHRVSWMLHNRRDRWQPNDILVLGPNPDYIRYISTVLPSLGNDTVVQLPITELGPRVQVSGVDPPDVRRLKGDGRMLRLMLRAVRNRQKPQRGPIDIEVAGRTVRLDGDRIVARAQELAGRPHNDAGRELRAFVLDEVQYFFTRRGLRGLAAIEDMMPSEATRGIDNYMERIWPALSPAGFLIELFSNRRHLETAGAGLFTGEEMARLLLSSDTTAAGRTWSVDDVPLLDLADALLNGTQPAYEHIVVDEAQNLSPMQLESIRRRSRTGWFTLLGDLAQATGPWAPDSWEEIALHLRREGVPSEIVELSLGYRLPAEIHDVAMRLLPDVAPRLTAPQALRSIGEDVMVRRCAPHDLATAVVEVTRGLLGTGLVGVVVDSAHREEITAAFDAAGLSWVGELQPGMAGIVVLGREDVTGLEFDSVVIVEPALIAGEPQGLRGLFVAMTRATNRLALVHAQPLPEILGLHSPPPPPPPPPPPAPPPGASPWSAADPWAPDPAAAVPQPVPSPGAATPPDGLPRSPASRGSLRHRDPGASTSNGVNARRDPLAGLDQAMARALAAKLAETLTRYVQPALFPLVIEEIRQLIDGTDLDGADLDGTDPDSTDPDGTDLDRTGGDSTQWTQGENHARPADPWDRTHRSEPGR
jgi:DNA helicase IV